MADTQVKKEVRYVNRDFASLRANLVNYAKVYFPNTYNDFNESSPGMMFIEMASYVGDTLSYYIDEQFKETMLSFAEEKKTIYNIAQGYGYKPRQASPATVILDVFQTVPSDPNNVSDGKRVELGDIIAYHNETTVDWLGTFVQGAYSANKLSAYGMVGVSNIAYSYQDHFTVADEKITADPISTIQWKGGAMYDVDDNVSVFANFGIVEKPPIMDNVIYFDGTVASDPANEKFISTEAGINFQSENFAVKANVYNTDWKDRNLTKAVSTGEGSSGDTDVIFLTGVNQKHSGLEVEAHMQVIDMLRIDAAASFGTWKFTDDATGNYQEDEFNEEGQVTGQKTTAYNYALKDLFVGDMPQTGMALGATVTPIDGLSVQALFNYYDKNYSDWSPNAREVGSDGTADREQVWMAPSYSKLDVHINYVLPVSIAGTKMTAFAHIFNALDAVYVQDAVDHSQYNSYGDKVHAAHNAEVFLGTPRYFNAGLKVNF